MIIGGLVHRPFVWASHSYFNTSECQPLLPPEQGSYIWIIMLEKLMLSKNVNNKKYAPKLIFFNEKKIEKDSDNFWYRKLTLKVKRLGDFALFDTSPLIQFSKFNNYLWVCSFLGKNISNFVPPVWKLHNPYCHSAHIRQIFHAIFRILISLFFGDHIELF